MKRLLAFAFLFIGFIAQAQANQIILETKNAALVLSVGNNKRVTNHTLKRSYLHQNINNCVAAIKCI